MKRLLLFIMIVTFAGSVSGQWVMCRDLMYMLNSDSYSIGKVLFVSENSGYYVTNQSGIHFLWYGINRTTDSWQTASYVSGDGGNYQGAYLLDLVFLNDSLGYKLSGNIGYNYVYRTYDGGHNWQMTDNDTTLFFATAISYPSDFLGYYLTNISSQTSSFDVIRSDSGTCSLHDIPSIYNNSISINFINDSTGFILCKNGSANYSCLRTDDYSETWANVLNIQGTMLNDIFFPSELTGYIAAENGSAYKTTDGGITWDSLPSGFSNDLKTVHFFIDSSGYMAGSNGLVIKTTDGGLNWSAEITGIAETITNIFAADTNSILILAGNKVYRKSLPINNVISHSLITPNPAKDKIIIYLDPSDVISEAEYSISDLGGHTVSNRQLNDLITEVDISGLIKGVYLIKIKNNGSTHVFKVVKE